MKLAVSVRSSEELRNVESKVIKIVKMLYVLVSCGNMSSGTPSMLDASLYVP